MRTSARTRAQLARTLFKPTVHEFQLAEVVTYVPLPGAGSRTGSVSSPQLAATVRVCTCGHAELDPVHAV